MPKLINIKGVTLVELLAVTIMIGLILATIVPRAHRATVEAKYAVIRQHGSEIASFVVQWGHDRTMVQDIAGIGITLKDLLTRNIHGDQAGINTRPLVNRYTGDTHFNQVGAIISNPEEIKNPFNKESYFSFFNDERNPDGVTIAPAIKPGLLYLASGRTGGAVPNALSFYFLMTGQQENGVPRWHGNMGVKGDALHKGIFVLLLP